MAAVALPTPIASTVSAPSKVALQIEHVSAEYRRGQTVLTDVSFTLEQGELAALVGPNGAGKSTLFQVIVGLIPHSTGEVFVHGHSHHAGDCFALGYVPQREAVDWRFPLSVLDVVLMGRVKELGWLRRPSAADRQAAREALDQVGLAAFAQRHISALSGGQQQRMFIARALFQRADVLLLDEPFSGVDMEAQASILALLDDLCAKGLTVLLSTHDLQLATTRFDRVLLLRNHLMANGPANTALTQDVLAAAYGGRLTVWQDGKAVTVTADDCCP